jgi:hypothetical protein
MLAPWTRQITDLGIAGVTNAVWDDLRITAGAFQFLGSSDPTLTTWQPSGSGASYLVYVFAKNDEVFAVAQLPHGYKEGSDLKVHMHWTPRNRGNEESGSLVGWKVDYSIANVGSNFGASTTADLSDACSGVDDRHEITSGVTVSGTGLTVSSMVMLRIYRSDTGADDTWVGTIAAELPALLEFDIHYQLDTAGSLQETSKT